MNGIRPIALGAAAAMALGLGAVPALAGTEAFVGTRQNVNFLNPPGTGRCAPLNTVSISPTGPSSSGTSNWGDFVVTASHCIAGPPGPDVPVRDVTDGEFLWEFALGDTLWGSYSGQAVWEAGVVTGTEFHVVTGGTGRFDGASGTITSVGLLQFGNVDGRPVGIFDGTLEGTIHVPAIPEPATALLLALGMGAVGAAARRRSAACTMKQPVARS